MVAVKVKVGDPLTNLGLGRKVKGGEPDAALAVAIGLALGV